MKLKVGKKYLVRSDLVINKKYGIEGCCFTQYMEHLRGQIITCDQINSFGWADSGQYNFAPEMLEKVKSPKCWPIETAPIGKLILVWFEEKKVWTDCLLIDEYHKEQFINGTNANFTHWRHQPKGPV